MFANIPVARALVLAVSLTVAGAGCGGDEKSGSAAATLAACNSYCDGVIARNCDDPPFTSAAECKTGECGDLSDVPAGCQSAAQAYYDCRKGQADICADTGCTSQFAALFSCG